MTKGGARYEPEPRSTRIYRRKYETYLAASSALEKLWTDYPSLADLQPSEK